MKFTDLTKKPPIQQELPLSEIRKLLKRKTGRNLVIKDMDLYLQNETLFELVCWPDPVGFGVVAAKLIPKNTSLFYYGGTLRKEKDILEDVGNAYLQQLNKDELLDGKESGDFGCLLAHAPEQKLLVEDLGFSLDDARVIQTVNVNSRPTKNKNLLFFASEDIPAGTVITHDYGDNFWRACKQTFLLFQRNSTELINLSNIKFDGNAYIRRHPDDGRNFENRRQPDKMISVYTQKLLLTAQVLLQANAVAKNPTNLDMCGDWSYMAAYMLSLSIQVTLEKSVLQTDEIEMFFQDKDAGVEFALDLSDCMTVLGKITNRQPDATTAYQITLNSLYGFFTARQIYRYIQDAKIDSCEPPPGSQIYKNRTILPNPFKFHR